MWITPADMCHQFRDKMYLQKQLKYYQDDYLVFPHYTSFTQMLSKLYIYIYIYIYIYMLLTNFTNMFLIP